MKRVLICMLALIMAAAVGCTGAKHNNGNTTPTPTPSASATDKAAETKEGEMRRDDQEARKYTPRPDETDGGIGTLERQTFVVTSEECFKEGGFVFFAAGVSTQLTVDMDSADTEAEWQIYVLDEKFSDAPRYIPQSYEPVLTESGKLSVTAGQYIYVYCSVNGFSSSDPAVGAAVTFTGQGLPEQ